MSVWAIVAAAGEGRRFGGPKAFAVCARIPMVAHSLIALAGVKAVEGIVLVLSGDEAAAANAMLATTRPSILAGVVRGGASRQASVRSGLERVPADVEQIVVHDGARPLVTSALVEAVIAGLAEAPGAVAAVPETDTLKEVGDGRVVRTIPREPLWRAQTPQAFHAKTLRRAHDRAVSEGFEGTDDAMLLERIGERVVIVPGDERNLKVTTAEDLALAEALLEVRQKGA